MATINANKRNERVLVDEEVIVLLLLLSLLIRDGTLSFFSFSQKEIVQQSSKGFPMSNVEIVDFDWCSSKEKPRRKESADGCFFFAFPSQIVSLFFPERVATSWNKRRVAFSSNETRRSK
jgi:hypothetical protein